MDRQRRKSNYYFPSHKHDAKVFNIDKNKILSFKYVQKAYKSKMIKDSLNREKDFSLMSHKKMN